MSEIKTHDDRTTVLPPETDEDTEESAKDPIVRPTDNWPKDEPIGDAKDPIVQPTDNWPKDEPTASPKSTKAVKTAKPTKDPIVQPTDNWPKDEPTADKG